MYAAGTRSAAAFVCCCYSALGVGGAWPRSVVALVTVAIEM